MAICGRCGRQTESADEVCNSCSELANSLVGAYSAAASRGSYSSAGEYGGQRPRHDPMAVPARHEPAGPEFASLPHFERPFAAEGTVWPDSPEIVLSPPDVDAPDDEAAGLEPGDAEEQDPDGHEWREGDQAQRGESAQRDPAGDPELPALAGAEALADGTGDGAPAPDLPAALSRGGRWIALTTATAVLAAAAAAAVTVVVRHDHAVQSARVDKPSVTASPSSPPAPSAAPTSQTQLIVDQTAATAPDEAAIAADLKRYFVAINNHDYLMYKRTFIMALRGTISPGSFSAEFGKATESGAQLRSISVLGGGDAEAVVTIVSQPTTPSSSVGKTCTAWSMKFFFGQRPSGYLQVAPPQWYRASDVSCV